MRGLLATTRGRVLVAGLAAVLLVGAVLAGLSILQPAPVAVVAPPQVPLVVSVPRVRSVGAATVGVPLMVSAHALGQTAVTALELWDGIELVASENAPPGTTSPALYARWQWVPQAPGEHALFIRAVDGRGRGAQSGATRISVAASAGASIPSGVIASVGAVAAPGQSSPKSISYGIASPQLEVTQAGCQLDLKVSGIPAEATGFAIYGIPPTSADFSPVTVKPAAGAGPVSVGLVGGGAFVFAPSAFGADQQSYGPPILVDAPPECAPGAGGWTGELAIVDGRLVGGSSVERAYLYLTEGDGAAVRLPTQPAQFVEAGADGALDFGALLPPIGPAPIDIEGWGWNSGVLVALGKGHYTPPSSSGGALTFGGGYSVGGNPVLPGAGSATKLWVIDKVLVTAATDPACGKEFCYVDEQSLASTIDRPAPGDTQPIIRNFQWSTISPNVNQIVWQVFAYPPGSTPDLNPPFVIDQGSVSVGAGQVEGQFPIDFAKYLKPIVPKVTLPGPGQQVAPNPVIVLPGSGGPPAPTATPAPGSDIVLANLPNLVAFSDRFYVRIVPLQVNVATLPSNAVTLDVVEPSNGPPLNIPPGAITFNENAYTISWTYTPPIAADPKYANCAIVTGFTSDYVAMPVWDQKYKASFQKQTPICYEPPDDDGWSPWDAFDSFVEYVADVWDYVADGVTWLKKQVATLLLAAVPCKAIASDSTCETLASVAVDMAIVAFTGMPPSLPNFEAAMAGLKGDLAKLIVESASSIPGVAAACGIADAANTVETKLKSCEELAEAAVDAAIDEMLDAASDAAGKSTGYAWPGVKWKADPRGQYHPPEFRITISRPTESVLPDECYVAASMESLVKGWKFPELQAGVVKSTTADVKGEPLLTSSISVPPLKVGQSVQRTLWLVHPRLKWFESPKAQLYWDYAEAMLDVPNFTRSWVLLTPGAELTFKVWSNCAKPSSKGPYILTQYTWDTP